MPEEPDQLAALIRGAIAEQMSRSPATRALLCEIARLVLAQADRLEAEESGTDDGPTEPDSSAPEPVQQPPEPRGLVPLNIGGATTQIEVPGDERQRAAAEAAYRDGTESDEGEGELPREIKLGLIARRCRLKAESCRHYILRREVIDDAEREPGVLEQLNAMIARAKSMPDCFLWVFWPHADQPDDDQLRLIASCYEGLAEAAELCSNATEPDTDLTRQEVKLAFQLLAETNSALRVALISTWLTSPDRDQDDAHQWLRQETFTRRVFVPRYMSLSDPADPARAEQAIAEIRGIAGMVSNRRSNQKRIDSLFNRIRYHARRLPESGEGDAHDLGRINDSIEELLELGMNPSDKRFHEFSALVPLAVFPEDTPPHDVLRKAHEVAEQRDRNQRDNEPTGEPEWSKRVIEVRELLKGGTVVLIGGEPRLDAIDRITQAFDLEDVDWVPLTEHGSGTPMRAPIARPETRLVLVLVKLTGHLHSDEARRYAREYDKPCVMLPAGYNPEQIAEQILQQAADRLGSKAPVAP